MSGYRRPAGIPSAETIWETINDGENTYYITSKESRDWYYIYKAGAGGRAEKLSRAASPATLTKKYCKEVETC